MNMFLLQLSLDLLIKFLNFYLYKFINVKSIKHLINIWFKNKVNFIKKVKENLRCLTHIFLLIQSVDNIRF